MAAECTVEKGRGSPRLQYEERKQKQLEESRILEPDNPLLGKFQKALKEHLLLQIEALKSDVFEYETGAKKKDAQRKELGLRVYEEQQTANKRQCILDNCIKQLETATAARIETESILIERKEVLKKERQNFIQAENKEIELKKEVEATNLLVYQLSNWENTLESNICTKQRTFEKSRLEKLRLLEEKRLQDGLIYKLMVRTWELEAELDKMNMQINVKEVEREELAATAALGNTNIEAINLECRSVMSSWNSVIVAVGSQDKVVACLSAEYHKIEEKFKNTIMEIEQVKKLCKKEMQKNEYLTLVKLRALYDISNAQVLKTEQLNIQMDIQRKINEMQAVTDRTEEDIEKISIQMSFENTKSVDVTRRFERLMQIKAGVEKDIMNMLEDQSTHDKAVTKLQGDVREVRRRRIRTDLMVAQCEANLSASLLQGEIQNRANDITQEVLDEVEGQVRSCQKEAETHDNELKQIVVGIETRTKEILLLNRRLSRNIDRTGGVLLSPVEIKISILEKEINEFQAEITELQDFWLTEQGHLLVVSRQKQELISKGNFLQTRITLMEQNNLKITDLLNEHQSKCDKISRNSNQLKNKLKVLSEKLYDKRGVKINTKHHNKAVQQEYANKLKDTELNCFRLSSEIEQLEDDKITLGNTLIELNREVLEWEKKFKMAKETKETMAEDKGKGGEVGHIQAGIRKMEVHYDHLKKIQKKLVDDLESCVARRGAIVNVARAIEKRALNNAPEKCRWVVSRKLDDMRNRVKQMENEIERNLKNINDAQATYSSLEFDVYNLEKEIELEKSTLEFMNEELEKSKTERQMNLDLVFLLQKRLALYNEVRKGRKPYIVHKNVISAINEHDNQLCVNKKLSEIIDNLKTHFPNYHHVLTRMSNTLNLLVAAGKRREERNKVKMSA